MSDRKGPSRGKYTALLVLLAISLIVNVVMVARKIHRKMTYDIPIGNRAETRVPLLAAMPIDSNTIVFIGDSHIENFPLNGLFPELPIQNLGISGNTSSHVVARMRALANTSPRKVFIEMGVNDLFHGRPISGIMENMDTLLTYVRKTSPRTELYIFSILPTLDPWYKDVILETNKELVALCKEKGVTYIDLYPLFAKENLARPDMVYDGIHLNAEGYKLWAHTLAPHLK